MPPTRPARRAPRPVTVQARQEDTWRNAAQAGRPFRDAQDAWFWTMAALLARRAGPASPRSRDFPRGVAATDDILKCLDTLYRRRRIDLGHVRILRKWGERGRAPDPAVAAQYADWQLWREALERLEWPLRVRGIVG